MSKERIKQLILSGLNDAMIAREVNLSREWVRQIRNYYGLKKNKLTYCSIISEEKFAEILKLTDKGYPYRQIIAKLNLPFKSNTSLFNLLKNYNIKYIRDKRKIHFKRRWTPELLAQFKADYERRGSVIELAEKYNIGLSRICHILNYKLGIYCNRSYSTASQKTIKHIRGLQSCRTYRHYQRS